MDIMKEGNGKCINDDDCHDIAYKLQHHHKHHDNIIINIIIITIIIIILLLLLITILIITLTYFIVMISITSRTVAGVLLVDGSLLEVQRLSPGDLLDEQLHSRQLDAVPPGQIPSYSAVQSTWYSRGGGV